MAAAHLVALDDGWHEWRDVPPGVEPELPELPTVRVRVAEGEDGRFHLVDLHVEGMVSAEVLRSIPVGRIEAAANAQLHPSAPDEVAGWPQATLTPALREDGRGYADDFYTEVAVAYRHLAATTHRPVAHLADANNVPVSTAQRWVKEARRRSLLAPGRPGKAG
jgi:hypothetical protein